MYIDMPHAWRPPIEQPPDHVETLPIDPLLHTTISPSELTTSGQTFVMVPEQFAEASRRLLIHLVKTVDIPDTPGEADEESAEEMMFTAEELEALEPIDEESLGSPTPSIIDGICVNPSPRPTKIKDVIDLRRVGPGRRTFYLAKTVDGAYYWFHSPHTHRDHQLRKLIGGYRRKSRAEAAGRETRGIKNLRSRTIAT